MAPPAQSPEQASDQTPRFVRITGERGGMVEFEYSVGDPQLVLELLLPPAAFEDFCAANNATLITGDREEADSEEARAMAWRPSDVNQRD